MLVKIPHGVIQWKYSNLYANQMYHRYNFRTEQCMIPGTYLNDQCDSIRTIYPIQVILLLTDILLSVFFAKIHSLVLSAKILFQVIFWH